MRSKIKHLLHLWTVCMQAADLLQLDMALEDILKDLRRYLQQNQHDPAFQEFMYFSLENLQTLPRNLRYKTLSYCHGHIQREVQHPQYRALKQCFSQYLKPIPWSDYYATIAREAIPATLLILLLSAMPGLVLATQNNQDTPAKNMPLCTHLLKIDYVQSDHILQNGKLQLAKMGVDYDMIPIAKIVYYEVDCFAANLTELCLDKLTARAERRWIDRLLNDDTLLEPLHLILTYAKNIPLRYQIIATLSLKLYRDIEIAKQPMHID